MRVVLGLNDTRFYDCADEFSRSRCQPSRNRRIRSSYPVMPTGSGRQRVMTPAVCKAVLEAIAKGTPRKFAAAGAGVGERTLYKYMRLGRLAKSGEAKDFYDALRCAEARSVAMRVERISGAAKKGAWQADCWWLERRYPEEFGSDRREVKVLQKQVLELATRLEQLTRASSPTPTPNEPDRPGVEPVGAAPTRAPAAERTVRDGLDAPVPPALPEG